MSAGICDNLLTAPPLPDGDAQVRDSDAVEEARRALGAELAAHRRAAGYSQTEFAAVLVGYSRSTIANVETGRQHVPPSFWQRADDALGVGGALIEANEQIEAAVRREREQAVRRSRLIALTLDDDCGDAVTGQLMRMAEADIGGWQDRITAAASEAREHTEKVAVTEIGPGMVEQLKADVVRLGRAYVSAPPLPLFAAMHRALGRIQNALDQKSYPAQARNLNFLAGAVCGLMANASLDLGREQAADDLGRAAWTYGRTIDHSALMGWARGTQALAAIWDHRHVDAARYAEDGLNHLPVGVGAARLHAIHARALSSGGDHSGARAAMKAAAEALVAAHRDELHDGVAGEFSFDQAKLQYYRALIWVDASDPISAETAAAGAVRLYQAAPARARSYGCEALARVQLARAQLMNNRLDDAAETLGSMLRLRPEMRISSLNHNVDACRDLLRNLPYRGLPAARRLEQELAEFSTASAVRALPRGG